MNCLGPAPQLISLHKCINLIHNLNYYNLKRNGVIKCLSIYSRQKQLQLVCTAVIKEEGSHSSFNYEKTTQNFNVNYRNKFKPKVTKFLQERHAERVKSSWQRYETPQ